VVEVLRLQKTKSKQQSFGKKNKKNDTKRWKIQKKSCPNDKEEKEKKTFFFFNKNIIYTLKGFFSKPKK